MRNRINTIAMSAAFLTAVASVPAEALDVEALENRGEFYVAALYGEYQTEADVLARSGEAEAASFLRGRAAAIEAGAEVFPSHPMGFTSLSDDQERVLTSAYDETFALAGSEAADVAPKRIAQVQVTYETWLIQSATHGDAAFDQGWAKWGTALEDFIEWSEGEPNPALSSLALPRAIRVSATGW